MDMDSEPQTRIAAEDYLDALAAHGEDYDRAWPERARQTMW